MSTAEQREDTSQADAAALWQDTVEVEAVRIGSLVRRRMEELRVQLGELAGSAAGGAGGFRDLHVLEALGHLTEASTRLRAFAELNHAALYKILKKYDKVMKGSEGLGTLYPRLVGATGLGDHARFSAFEAEVHEATVRASPLQGLSVSPEVARLVAGLGSREGGEIDRKRRAERVMYFFLGSSSALFVSILVLVGLPPQDEDGTFNQSYFLSSFAVFRVVLSVLLCLWGMGAVAQLCRDNHINHMFILQVDPRCRVGANFFFKKAALLTSLWIVFFGMYIIDYKWMVLPAVGTHGYNSRSSWHYVLYPSALLACTLLMGLSPSGVCSGAYKAQVMRGVWRTCMAPLFAVTFGDNLIGDVMTSLAKPLQDIPGSVCYLASHHPQTEASVKNFTDHDNNCPAEPMVIALPLIAALPYVFRTLQCWRRFIDTKESKHLCNLGKYLASLLVVVATSLWGSKAGCVIVISIFATAYAAIWDVRMDWGLGLEEFGLKPSMAGDAARAAGQEVRESRHFQPRTYWICTIADVLMRLSWVITLMPLHIISKDIVQREVLRTSVSAVEIVRRSMWAVLRIENEQVANASGYRALLWVPRVIDTGDGGDRRRSLELRGEPPPRGLRGPEELSSATRIPIPAPPDPGAAPASGAPPQDGAAGGGEECDLVMVPSAPPSRAVAAAPLLSA